MRTASVLVASALLGLAGATLLLHARTRELEQRLDTLRTDLARPGERREATPAASGPVLEGAPATAAEVSALRRDLEAQVAGLAARLPGPDAARPAALPAGEDFEAGVRDVLAKVADEPEFQRKVAEVAAKPALGKKPTFAALAQHLALDGSQEASFRRDLEDAQGALLALLAEARPDGRVLLEEIQKAEALPEGDPGRTAVFLDLVKLTIPGTEQTYLERAVVLATEFRKRADGYLRPEQRERFAALDVDLFGVRMN